jgi:hypothetical protein
MKGMLLHALREKSPTVSPASRMTSVAGVFYLCTGLAICAAPAIVPTVFFEPGFAGREAGIFRLVGWIMAVVGGFLWVGGRSGARSFVAAGIVARLAVPLVVIPLAVAGIFPHMMMIFGVLDPLTGLLTWRLMSSAPPLAAGAHAPTSARNA